MLCFQAALNSPVGLYASRAFITVSLMGYAYKVVYPAWRGSRRRSAELEKVSVKFINGISSTPFGFYKSLIQIKRLFIEEGGIQTRP